MEATGPKVAHQSRRYLMQLRCDTTHGDVTGDVLQAHLAALRTTVDVFGGQIEHHWASLREYDLVLVIKLPAHQISFASLEMAIDGTSFVRSVHSARLYALDRPVSDVEPAWKQAFDEGSLAHWEDDESTESVGERATCSAVLEPMNWDEY